MKYDIRVNLTAWAFGVEAESKDDALMKVADGRMWELFPNDPDIQSVEHIMYAGEIYESED